MSLKSDAIIYHTNDHVREYDVVAIVHEYDEEVKLHYASKEINL